MEFTEKKLVSLIGVTQPALFKALKFSPSKLKEVEGSSKKVKHYELEDLPERYIKNLEIHGYKIEKEDKTTNISITNYSQKYLLSTPTKQKQAVLKCRLVDFYLKKDDSLSAQKWLTQTLLNDMGFDLLGNVSMKQLYDWLKKYKDNKSKGLNIVDAFVDSRGAVKGVKALAEMQIKEAEGYFLRANRPMISEVYRNMCHTFGDTMPSYDVLNNYYKQWKRKNPILYEFSKSPDSAKNKYLTAYGDMSEKAKFRNHYWELDSTPADVICEDGKRYSVIAAVDVYTRRAVFHVCESSSAYTISQLLRKAILKLGIPENVVIDNGKDYTSNHFETICLNLGININIVPPFSGECKPFVERIFGTLSRELFEQIPGYIGHDVAQRKEIQARQSFADKIRSQEKWREEQALKSDEEKQLWRDAWKIKKDNIGLELTVLLSSKELDFWIDEWTDKIYEQRRHSGLETKPILKWNRDLTPVQSIPDERMLCMLLGESVTRKVGKEGINFDGCKYAHIELVEITGQVVYVMPSEDLGLIYIFDESMRFICIAEDLAVMGQKRSLAKAAKKKSLALMKQLDKIVKEAASMKAVTILDRIESVTDVIESKTYAVTKRTDTVDALFRESKNIEKFDKQQLEKSKTYDFKNKDEEGKPQKILPSGRPLFTAFIDRFVWDLEHDMVDETTKALAKEHPSLWEKAQEQAKVS